MTILVLAISKTGGESLVQLEANAFMVEMLVEQGVGRFAPAISTRLNWSKIEGSSSECAWNFAPCPRWSLPKGVLPHVGAVMFRGERARERHQLAVLAEHLIVRFEEPTKRVTIANYHLPEFGTERN